MAKKRKKAQKSKKVEEPKTNNFWPGVAAVALIIVGIILAFGAFISAPIPAKMWDGAWEAFGLATVILPIALIYLGALKFLSGKTRRCR